MDHQKVYTRDVCWRLIRRLALEDKNMYLWRFHDEGIFTHEKLHDQIETLIVEMTGY
jgi:hypothetical protein